MRALRRNRAIRISIAAAIGLVAVLVGALFVYLITTAQHRDRVAMAYEASRAASLVYEAYANAGTVDGSMLPEEVRGFAVYNADGVALYRHGSAPEMLSPEHSKLRVPGRTALHDSVLRIVQPVGTLELLRSLPDGTEELSGPGPPEGHTDPARASRPQAVLLDYNVSAHMERAAIRRSAWIGAGVVIVLLTALLFGLSRRLRRYEDEAERQRRLVQLGQAARTLTHEIKNPLGAIKLQVAVLRRQLGGTQDEALRILEEELNRINNLVERVRDFLHSSPGTPEEFDLADLASQLPERFDFPVELQLETKPLPVRADRERLRSVLINLIQNAHESMQSTHETAHSSQPPQQPPDTDEAAAGTVQTGTLQVSGDTMQEAPVRVTVGHRKEGTVIEVEDSGPGISPEERERIFDPFYTTKPHGSGVGLAITRQFVESMNGSIHIHNRHEGGTRVRVVLP